MLRNHVTKARNGGRQTALMGAATDDNLRVVRHLVGLGCDVNARTKSGGCVGKLLS